MADKKSTTEEAVEGVADIVKGAAAGAVAAAKEGASALGAAAGAAAVGTSKIVDAAVEGGKTVAALNEEAEAERQSEIQERVVAGKKANPDADVKDLREQEERNQSWKELSELQKPGTM